MIFKLSSYLSSIYGPARLLQSYAVIVIFAIIGGFLLTLFLLPRFYKWLPQDRGRDFTITIEAAKGKPTGSGIIFISIFTLLAFLLAPVNLRQACIIILTWLC
ncbi:MAG TPA: phospho-N-acetylmuramoyl-pentapeptide-transferase, partial [Treponemataceae bacterium]|nr:phospho-N-acetylmuramoyl-pentapeptide-transferase [Treponemataceae bacterium]